jgi:hypothetical protein
MPCNCIYDGVCCNTNELELSLSALIKGANALSSALEA